MALICFPTSKISAFLDFFEGKQAGKRGSFKINLFKSTG
jgi:hypothetical protein